MNVKKIGSYLIAAVFALGIAAGIGQARAKTSQTTQVKPLTQTFTGEVTRSPDDRERQTPYILYDQTRQTNYFLDDNGRNLGRYDGDEVQVTGTLNRAGDTIHVQSIQAPPAEATPFSSAGK